MVKVAIVQEPPVYLNLVRSMELAVELVGKAASEGAELFVFPEAWLSGYPTFVWRLKPGAGMGQTDTLYARLLANAVDTKSGGLEPLCEAARDNGVDHHHRFPCFCTILATLCDSYHD